MNILIYNDYIHNNYDAIRFLANFFPHAKIQQCDHRDITQGILDSIPDLFVMPGGADLYYVEKLNGLGNTKIKTYVEQGGKYLGICAGAYYGCAHLEFAKGWPNEFEISGPRELSFYTGRAIGPIREYSDPAQRIPSCYDSVCTLSYTDTDKSEEITLKAHYNGGPYFSNSAEHANSETVEVLAQYTDIPHHPAAIILCRQGKGRALLIGPHLEDSAALILAKSYARNDTLSKREAIAQAIKADEDKRSKLWHKLFDKLFGE
tara:strand:- start:58771 stop:59556 length:786 start_codon:yes stop_codon:yes gene_type:complete